MRSPSTRVPGSRPSFSNSAVCVSRDTRRALKLTGSFARCLRVSLPDAEIEVGVGGD